MQCLTKADREENGLGWLIAGCPMESHAEARCFRGRQTNTKNTERRCTAERETR